ncbi:ATP-binding cassette transporter [Glomus cerebriforme]|uniref:ATP-binding cassette transporter n=1 Tax=Glomus cerebriforme TaxID=658196 RepID=A0A397TNJ9_9GLOM|nr:ATP-binding cassette transporter [Glomus cerebriforme]
MADPSNISSDTPTQNYSRTDIKTSTKTIKDVSFFQLFRYASPLDKLMIFFGSISALASGAANPLMTILFSAVIQAFLDFSIAESRGKDIDIAANELRKTVVKIVILMVVLAAAVFVLSFLQMGLWMIAGENQAMRVRQIYYAAILRQDIAYFDKISTGDITNRITSDSDMYQEGISEKVGLIIQYIATFITAFVIAFTKGWLLSLVLCSAFPLLAGAAGIMSKLLADSSKKGQDAYGEAGAVAEQVFSGIRTVTAFGGQQREINRYVEKLQNAYEVGRKKAIITGSSIAFIMFCMFSTYALAFWYGSILIVQGKTTGGDVLNIFSAILIGAFAIGNAAPSISAIGSARGAASNLFSVIDRIPPINSDSSDGKILNKSTVKGRLEFHNIKFHYPARPDIPILKNFNLTIEPGETVALVGTSGSGKSTIVGLLERFYDPIEGQILLDGENIKDINIRSLRSQIGLVGQEPVLFPKSVRQNIAWGVNADMPEPSLEEVIEACKKSNAHDFINELPQKYDTDVGEKGSLMSGGQKQRIAIARALIKNPTILLLDEATSALDSESERLVQDALDTASTGRTTIVIAHRLSTIKNADKIVVMSQGDILEIGRHDELIASKGVYFGLVQAQELKTKKEESDLFDDDDDDQSVSITLDEKKHKNFLRRIETKASTVKSIQEIEENEKRSKQSAPIARVLRLQKPEIPYLIIASLGAMINGSVMPLFSLVFSTLLSIFAEIDKPHELRHDANFWAGIFFVLAIVAFLANSVQHGFFILSGEKLSKRLRTMVFTHLLKQEIGFFDEDKNNTGALTSQLATDATKVEGLTGALMGNIVQSITNVVVGLTIAFSFGWKLTLVITAATPCLFAAGILQMKTLAGFGAKTRKAYEESGQIVQQSVANMRTIASLTREGTFKELYQNSTRMPHRIAIEGSMVSAIGFGLSQCLLFLVYALAFWYGGLLVSNQEYTQPQMLKVLFAVIFSAMAAGQTSTFAPDFAKAKNSAISIFKLLDRESKIDPTDVEGKDRPTPITGSGEIQNAHFNYPARPNLRILRGLDLAIESGKTIALVGGSGSGKSTVVSLFLRYYDVLSGEVDLEKVNVKDWNIEYLRSNMAIVGQEPVLFDLTIGENIAYGKEGCSQEEIETAAKDANIHNFIVSLPKGYDTPAGERGTQLSGGQKQRIAIARALIRRPKLLLLDEATSALDSESEKVVQDALDHAAKGRTTITIAHRLSTIQNADLICVVRKGKIVEKGQHFNLIAQRGYYYELVNKQMLINQH